MMKSLFFAATLLTSAAVTAQVSHVWIDGVGGNDANAGTRAMPFKTLTKGLLHQKSGVVVHILPAIYGPTTTGDFWDSSLSKSKVIQLNNHANYWVVGEDRDKCIIDFNGMSDQYWAFIQIRGAATNGVQVSNLTFRNVGTTGSWACGPLHVHGGNDKDVNIHSNVYIDTNSTFINWSGTDVAFHDNLILSTTKGQGVAVRIRTNGTSGDRTYVYNNVIYNTGHGISWSNNAAGPKQWICNNIVLGANIGFPGSAPAAYVTMKNNIAFQCTTNYAYTPDASNLTVDPKLVDPAKGDFKQQASSPCLDGGYAVGLLHMVNDFFGNARVNDGDDDITSRPDIGIHESHDVSLAVTRWGQGQVALFTAQKVGAPTYPGGIFLLGAGPGSIVASPFGVIGLDVTQLLLNVPISVPGSVPLPIPTDPKLTGAAVYVQAFGFRAVTGGLTFKPSGRLDLHL